MSRDTSPAVTRDEFAQRLARSGLAATDELADYLATVPPSQAADGPAAAALLVTLGKLTRYQADAVLADRPGDLRMGNYDLLEKLGAGGMGAVYKARHRRMKRVVALKTVRRDASQPAAFAQRFQREVETIAQLAHPNIVMAFDADEADAGPFLVMEYVDGRDLAVEVQCRGPLPIALAADTVAQAARGLAYAHGRQIIHRDIKPGNLLRDRSGVVKVTDLGLARLTTAGSGGGHGGLTVAGGVVGTLDYMPPEQAAGSAAVDHRADVYSLGATLYFLLTGRPPFTANSPVGLLLRHRDAPAPCLRRARPDVPARLDDLFRRMLAKDPDDRPQSMAAVADALAAVLAGYEPPANAGGGAPGTVADAPGAAFSLSFGVPSDVKAATSHEFETVTGPPATSPLAGVTLLLVESSRTQAGIIRAYLRGAGAAEVHVRTTGAAAISDVVPSGTRVVVSGMHLPDMSGVELAAVLRSTPETAGVGFVLATSESDDGGTPVPPHVVRMPKPFTPDRLAQAVIRAVRTTGASAGPVDLASAG